MLIISLLSRKDIEQLLSIVLWREAVEEEIEGIVRVAEYVDDELAEMSLAVHAAEEQERDPVGQLREEKVEIREQQHVQYLTTLFRALVDHRSIVLVPQVVE